MPVFRNSINDINSKKPIHSKLTAIELAECIYSKNGKCHSRVICRCLCGKIKEYNVSAVIRGTTVSCGCWKKNPRPYRHSKYPNHLRKVYRGILDRCYNENHVGFLNYGGRGVEVCSLWLHNPHEFFEWALKNGWEKGLQIDKDIKGDGHLYSPDTCSIVTPLENSNNKRTCVKFKFGDQLLTVPEIKRITGLSDNKVMRNINKITREYINR